MGKFTINRSKAGYTFNLKSGNGEIIAVGGEVYSSLATCKKGIASVAANARIASLEDQTVEGYQTAKCPKFEVYLDKKGEFRFRLKASNGKVIAASEGYTAKASCKNGIESVRKNSVNAVIVEPEK